MSGLERILPRYHAILAGNELAGYLRLKRHGVSIDVSLDQTALWDLHRKEMSRFRSGPIEGGNGNLLDLKVELARRMLTRCEMCERRCNVDRTSGVRGHCGVLDARISSDFLHMGEEPPLVPSYTVFFSGCTMECVFCQNHDISTRPEAGAHIGPEVMADRIERHFWHEGMWSGGRAKNVNWVGGEPTPNLHYILMVLQECRANIPQIWNSNMYLTTSSMELLDGVVDLFLTDFKYGNDACARRLSKVPDYFRIVSRNHLLASEQAEVIIRHLVLPNHVDCCSIPILEWIAENTPQAQVNVMAQYRPMHLASHYPEIRLCLAPEEYNRTYRRAEELGLNLMD